MVDRHESHDVAVDGVLKHHFGAPDSKHPSIVLPLLSCSLHVLVYQR